MRNVMIFSLIALLLGGCASKKDIDGYTYTPYCLLNSDQRNPNIEYELSVGSLIVGMTIISLVRSYLFRRFFNWLYLKGIK